AMDELVELERAIEITETVIEVGRDEVRQETGVDEKTFNERAAPFERKAGPKHWLRRSIENGQEVVRISRPSGNGFTSGTPTAEEIESGEFFQSAEEWRRANDGLAQ